MSRSRCASWLGVRIIGVPRLPQMLTCRVAGLKRNLHGLHEDGIMV